MKTFDIARILGGAAIVSLFAVHGALADNTGHNTKIACYALVHSECYGNGQNNCSDEVYQGGLDDCDNAVFDQGRPTNTIGGFKATANNQGGFMMKRGTRRQ